LARGNEGVADVSALSRANSGVLAAASAHRRTASPPLARFPQTVRDFPGNSRLIFARSERRYVRPQTLMRLLERRQYQMFGRVAAFGRAHMALFPSSSRAGATFAALDAVLARLDEHTKTKVTPLRYPDRARARKALRRELYTLARTAKLMALDTPGADAQFRFPVRETDHQLIAAARVFAASAAACERDFIAHAHPATFRRDLTALADALEHAIGGQSAHRSRHIYAGAAIDEALREGLLVVHTLDVIVRNSVARRAPEIATWTAARRVAYSRKPDR
jgi:hypothetical protein